MNKKQQTWMIHLGAAKIPKEWYENRNPEKPDGRSNPKTPRQQQHRAAKKLKRGIHALIKNPLIKGCKHAYEILQERNFLPMTTEKKQMSYARFYYYWNLVMKEKNIKKQKRYESAIHRRKLQ